MIIRLTRAELKKKRDKVQKTVMMRMMTKEKMVTISMMR